MPDHRPVFSKCVFRNFLGFNWPHFFCQTLLDSLPYSVACEKNTNLLVNSAFTTGSFKDSFKVSKIVLILLFTTYKCEIIIEVVTRTTVDTFFD